MRDSCPCYWSMCWGQKGITKLGKIHIHFPSSSSNEDQGFKASSLVLQVNISLQSFSDVLLPLSFFFNRNLTKNMRIIFQSPPKLWAPEPAFHNRNTEFLSAIPPNQAPCSLSWWSWKYTYNPVAHFTSAQLIHRKPKTSRNLKFHRSCWLWRRLGKAQHYETKASKPKIDQQAESPQEGSSVPQELSKTQPPFSAQISPPTSSFPAPHNMNPLVLVGV